MSRHHLPFGCISANALHALARKLDSLTGWHISRGGKLIDAPCLHSIEADVGERIIARISASPALLWTFVYCDGVWTSLEGDA